MQVINVLSSVFVDVYVTCRGTVNFYVSVSVVHINSAIGVSYTYLSVNDAHNTLHFSRIRGSVVVYNVELCESLPIPYPYIYMCFTINLYLQ
jgi:hypothetical protein